MLMSDVRDSSSEVGAQTGKATEVAPPGAEAPANIEAEVARTGATASDIATSPSFPMAP